MENVMFEMADRLKSLREQKKQKELELKNINDMIFEIDAALSQLMIMKETQNFTRNGTMFCLNSSIKASAVAGSKEELFEKLRREGYGDLIYETVNPQSLSSFVKEQLSENEDKLPIWLDGLVNVFEKTNVSVRKHSKK